MERFNDMVSTIQTPSGKEFCTEEAMLSWDEMTAVERAAFEGMTDNETILAIYRSLYNYNVG